MLLRLHKAIPSFIRRDLLPLLGRPLLANWNDDRRRNRSYQHNQYRPLFAIHATPPRAACVAGIQPASGR